MYPPPLTSINAGERGFLTFWLPVVSSRFQWLMSSKCRQNVVTKQDQNPSSTTLFTPTTSPHKQINPALSTLSQQDGAKCSEKTTSLGRQ
nr:MAG TPA: hypothetical protein [Caudoviricetes sp.]